MGVCYFVRDKSRHLYLSAKAAQSELLGALNPRQSRYEVQGTEKIAGKSAPSRELQTLRRAPRSAG
jgi:hypothetical protein